MIKILEITTTTVITINIIRKILTYVLRFFNKRNFSNKKEGHILGSHPTQDSSHHQDYYISRFQKFPNLNLHLPHCYLLVYPQPKNSQIHNPWLLPLCCAPFCCLGTPLDRVHPWHLDSLVQRPPWRSQDRWRSPGTGDNGFQERKTSVLKYQRAKNSWERCISYGT